MSQVGGSGDSMLKCQDLPSIVPYCGIQSDGIDQPLNLLGRLIQSGRTCRSVSLYSSLFAYHMHTFFCYILSILMGQIKNYCAFMIANVIF